MGADGRRKIRLRRKTNSELFQLYDAQLVLKHRSEDALSEARRLLSHFSAHLGEFPPSPELATGFLAQFANLKPTSLYRYTSIIKGFISWYGEKLEIKIKLPEQLPDYIEQDAIEKLKDAMRSKKTHKRVIDRNLLLIDLACKAGLRRTELANLMVKDVDLERNYLIVRQGKGMKDRIIDLTPSLLHSFEIYLKGKSPDDSVFGLSPNTISGIIRWAAKKAGVNIHTHSLRHFFGQSLVDTGTDIETVRRLMGHKNLKTTQVYIGRTDKQRREAIERLEKPVREISIGTESRVQASSYADQRKQQDDFKHAEESIELDTLITKLKAIKANLGGVGFSALEIIRYHWGKFEQGVSRIDFADILRKSYPTENPGMEYFEVADILLQHLSIYQVIKSEQRRLAYPHSQQDVTYWTITDNGKKIVQILLN
ncbi:MAG: hypothetical protein A2Z74_05780 [Chloroflexi bacterium RBG_13_46_9]|nr:MAG: hypothetical protein A2Z74_05780 [Chloroflexi bacterium RBG_13_46_9]